MAVALNNLPDHELALHLKEGSTSAFTVIYERYWKQLFVMASKRLGDEDEAEEIVQEIFLNLWRRRETFNLSTGFANYLSIAVKFEILDAMRKRAHVSKYSQELTNSFTEVDESLLKQLDMDELQQTLQLTIKALPEKCQLVYKLKYEQGYSQKQIASELNISEKTVEAHLSKARKVLRGKFGYVLLAFLAFYFPKI
ncbi:RNA polymerase sigma-70 factor [Mucilaginibacter sp. CSA2-8R]|uniref:RNA polymerase sigma factor n=1 Tax=Mucilaginibacter sp. CSA2-8R TaxID=3141542 RepID=UPI00315D6265